MLLLKFCLYWRKERQRWMQTQRIILHMLCPLEQNLWRELFTLQLGSSHCNYCSVTESTDTTCPQANAFKKLLFRSSSLVSKYLMLGIGIRMVMLVDHTPFTPNHLNL